MSLKQATTQLPFIAFQQMQEHAVNSQIDDDDDGEQSDLEHALSSHSDAEGETAEAGPSRASKATRAGKASQRPDRKSYPGLNPNPNPNPMLGNVPAGLSLEQVFALLMAQRGPGIKMVQPPPTPGTQGAPLFDGRDIS